MEQLKARIDELTIDINKIELTLSQTEGLAVLSYGEISSIKDEIERLKHFVDMLDPNPFLNQTKLQEFAKPLSDIRTRIEDLKHGYLRQTYNAANILLQKSLPLIGQELICDELSFKIDSIEMRPADYESERTYLDCIRMGNSMEDCFASYAQASVVVKYISFITIQPGTIGILNLIKFNPQLSYLTEL